MDIQELELKLNKLREEYRGAKESDKKLLAIRGKCLKIALESKLKKSGAFSKNVAMTI